MQPLSFNNPLSQSSSSSSSQIPAKKLSKLELLPRPVHKIIAQFLVDPVTHLSSKGATLFSLSKTTANACDRLVLSNFSIHQYEHIEVTRAETQYRCLTRLRRYEKEECKKVTKTAADFMSFSGTAINFSLDDARATQRSEGLISTKIVRTRIIPRIIRLLPALLQAFPKVHTIDTSFDELDEIDLYTLSQNKTLTSIIIHGSILAYMQHSIRFGFADVQHKLSLLLTIPNLKHLDLHKIFKSADGGITCLAKRPDLQSLTCAPESDDDIKAIAKISSLQRLHIRWTRSLITSYQPLENLSELREITLDTLSVNPAPLPFFMKLKKLEQLKIEHFYGNPVDLSQFLAQMHAENLKAVEINSRDDKITYSTPLRNYSLEKLLLFDKPFSTKELEHLSLLQSLKVLGLRLPLSTDPLVYAPIQNIKLLETLFLISLTDTATKSLLASLETLIPFLQKLPQLRTFGLYLSSEKGWIRFAGAAGTAPIIEKAEQLFAKELPHCYVEIVWSTDLEGIQPPLLRRHAS